MVGTQEHSKRTWLVSPFTSMKPLRQVNKESSGQSFRVTGRVVSQVQPSVGSGQASSSSSQVCGAPLQSNCAGAQPPLPVVLAPPEVAPPVLESSPLAEPPLEVLPVVMMTGAPPVAAAPPVSSPSTLPLLVVAASSLQPSVKPTQRANGTNRLHFDARILTRSSLFKSPGKLAFPRTANAGPRRYEAHEVLPPRSAFSERRRALGGFGRAAPLSWSKLSAATVELAGTTLLCGAGRSAAPVWGSCWVGQALGGLLASRARGWGRGLRLFPFLQAARPSLVE